MYSSVDETDEVEKSVVSDQSATDEDLAKPIDDAADPVEETVGEEETAGESVEEEVNIEPESTEQDDTEQDNTEQEDAEQEDAEPEDTEQGNAAALSPEEASAEEEVIEEQASQPEESETESVEQESVEETPAAPKSRRLKKVKAAELSFEWYVIKVANGREDTLSRKVEKTLSLRELDKHVRTIVVPKQKVTEIKDGKKRVREHKLYQGYFFMECQLVDEIWYLLRDIQGVGSFVGGALGAKPMPMVPDEVRKLRDMIEQRESEAPPELKIDVKKNDTVKVKDGPFENFEGIVEEVHPKTGKLRVMVTIFGRETPVDLEYWQVEQT